MRRTQEKIEPNQETDEMIKPSKNQVTGEMGTQETLEPPVNRPVEHRRRCDPEPNHETEEKNPGGDGT